MEDRTYIVTPEAWYAESAHMRHGVAYEIGIQGDGYEYAAEWMDFSDPWAMRVAVFDDAFRAFEDHAGLFTALRLFAEEHGPNEGRYRRGPLPDEFRRMLDELGFVDVTERESPIKPRDEGVCPRCGRS